MEVPWAHNEVVPDLELHNSRLQQIHAISLYLGTAVTLSTTLGSAKASNDATHLLSFWILRKHFDSRCCLRRQNPCSRMEIQIVTTEVYRKVHNLQSKSTESHGSKEGKKFCRDMFPRFNEIPEPFALRARESKLCSHLVVMPRIIFSRRNMRLQQNVLY